MDELIEQLDKAEGPSRSLDARIALAVYPERFKELVITDNSDLPSFASVFGVLRYTTDIGAAISLIPSGCDWTIEPDHAWVRWMGADDVKEAQGGFNGREGEATALAICVAALSAIAGVERIPKVAA